MMDRRCVPLWVIRDDVRPAHGRFTPKADEKFPLSSGGSTSRPAPAILVVVADLFSQTRLRLALFLAGRLRQGGALRQAHDIALDGNPRNVAIQSRNLIAQHGEVRAKSGSRLIACG